MDSIYRIMIALARRLQNQLLEIKSLFFLTRAYHHCDEIEIVHLEQNLVGIQFEKVCLPWQKDCKTSRWN